MKARRGFRVLALGCLAYDRGVSHAEFRSNTTLLDFDLVFWDPSMTIGEYGEDYPREFQGRPSLSSDESARFQADLVRRKAEVEEFLALGRTLVLFACGPQSCYVDTGQRQYSGTGKNARQTKIVSEVFVESVIPFKVVSRPAEGRQAELCAPEPYSAFWKDVSDISEYHACFSISNAFPFLRIKGTANAVGAFVAHKRGGVLVVPHPALSDLKLESEAEKVQTRYRESALVLAEAVRRESGDFSLPTWAGDYRFGVGGTLLGEVARLEGERERILRSLDEAKSKLAMHDARKILFAGTGRALEEKTKDAFRALGFEVFEVEGNRDDFIVRRGTLVAVVEVKGVTKSGAEKHAAQLEKWAAGYLEKNGEKAKPILVVNTFMGAPLEERTELDFPDQMIPYATSRGHALVTGVQLLCAWLEAEEHPERADEIVASIFAASGRWERYADWQNRLGVKPRPGPAIS